MDTDQRDRTAARRRTVAAPLYDARFEHDACGVGFVADAGGQSRDRVLPLALAGLAALAHRGAFGADGESSDGAGVALPLDRSAAGLLTGDPTPPRRGPASSYLPAPWPDRATAPPGRSSSGSSPRPACASSRWRPVPFGPVRSVRPPPRRGPTVVQAFVGRPAR